MIPITRSLLGTSSGNASPIVSMTVGVNPAKNPSGALSFCRP